MEENTPFILPGIAILQAQHSTAWSSYNSNLEAAGGSWFPTMNELIKKDLPLDFDSQDRESTPLELQRTTNNKKSRFQFPMCNRCDDFRSDTLL